MSLKRSPLKRTSSLKPGGPLRRSPFKARTVVPPTRVPGLRSDPVASGGDPRPWLKPTGSLRRTRLKPMSAKRAAERPERDRVRAAVLKRDGYRCRVARFFPDVRCGGGLHVHHLQKAGQCGPFTEANLVACCDVHNAIVEDRPIEAEALGLVIRPGPMT